MTGTTMLTVGEEDVMALIGRKEVELMLARRTIAEQARALRELAAHVEQTGAEASATGDPAT